MVASCHFLVRCYLFVAWAAGRVHGTGEILEIPDSKRQKALSTGPNPRPEPATADRVPG
jgi:hypothetical protein